MLLMPSLWYEGFGLSVMEAMLHGIPGDRERRRRPGRSQDGHALRGAGAAASSAIEPVFDERGMPKPVIEPTPIEPWADAVRALLTDRALYEHESRHRARRRWRSSAACDAGQLEELLQSLEPHQRASGTLSHGEPLAREARAAAAAAAQERGAKTV